jgi:hypothetical protein
MTAVSAPSKQPSLRTECEQQLRNRPRTTSVTTVPLSTHDLKGVLAQFTLEASYETVVSRVKKHGQQLVTRRGEQRPRWQPATLKKALATVSCYFYGGDAPRLFGGGVLERVRSEFARECVMCELTNAPGQQTDWYEAYRDLALTESRAQLNV